MQCNCHIISSWTSDCIKTWFFLCVYLFLLKKKNLLKQYSPDSLQCLLGDDCIWNSYILFSSCFCLLLTKKRIKGVWLFPFIVSFYLFPLCSQDPPTFHTWQKVYNSSVRYNCLLKTYVILCWQRSRGRWVFTTSWEREQVKVSK